MKDEGSRRNDESDLRALASFILPPSSFRPNALVLMEALVGPLKSDDSALASAYEQLFQQAQTRLLPITHTILRDAARLRATT